MTALSRDSLFCFEVSCHHDNKLVGYLIGNGSKMIQLNFHTQTLKMKMSNQELFTALSRGPSEVKLELIG